MDGVAFIPTSTTTYTVTGMAASGCTSTATQTIVVTPCLINVQVSAFLQGYYVNSSLMNGVLLNQGVSGTSMTDVDSVTIELHQSIAPFNALYSFKGKLQTNGILNASFPNEVVGQSLYIVVKHRNSIETWSATPVLISNLTVYDFSAEASQAYGDNQTEVESGVFAIYSGDINQDGFIDSFDFPALDNDIFNGVSSMYVNTDLNGDGFVDSFDFPVFDANSYNGVSAMMP